MTIDYEIVGLVKDTKYTVLEEFTPIAHWPRLRKRTMLLSSIWSFAPTCLQPIRAKVVRMVLGESGLLLLCGVLCGTGLAVLSSRWAANLLFGLTPWDPASHPHDRPARRIRATFVSLRSSKGEMITDVRYAVRALHRAPGFTLVCSLMLAMSIGAATAVFSVVNGVLIKPLSYPDADALVSLWNRPQAGDQTGEVPVSATQFFTYLDESRVFTAFGLWSRGPAIVTGRPEPEEVQAVRVTHGTLQALGIPPAAGRWFGQSDDTPGAPETVILSNAYWTRHGADPGVIGGTLVIDARARTVIGVMPEGFRFLDDTPDLLLPLHIDRSSLSLGAFNYFALGRLKPGVTKANANADVARLVPIWLDAWPSPPGFDKQHFARAPVLRPLKQDVVGDAGDVLWVLMGTITLVVVIAAANVANLLLIRAERRRQELAIRAALGASRLRIARQLLVESLVLGTIGGALGLGVTIASIRLLVAFAPAGLPRLDDITIDPVVLAFALLVSLVSSVVFGWFPVVRHAGRHVIPQLREGDRASSDSRGQLRTRHTLVVLQVALALVLLVGSGLMIRTFVALRAVDPGFADPDRVQLIRVTIPRTLVDDPEQVFRMQRDMRERIAAIPGVEAAALTSAAPMEPFISGNVLFTEDARHAEGKNRRFKFVSPGYFATVGTTVVAGRDFTWSEVDQRRPVTIISENLAREMWQDPPAALGQRIRENPEGPWREIVGVAADVVDDGVDVPPPATAYWPPLMEHFEGERLRIRRSMTIAIRSSRAGTEALLKDVQTSVWAVNGSLPLARVQTLDALYERSLARTSLTLVMLALAASMALLLGLVGIYGVIAYAVTQRTREIGIRVALGAEPGELTRTFIRDGVVLAIIGVVGGVLAAVAATRLMTSLLFGIGPLDPATYVAVSAALMTAAALASYIPARRATSVDPMEALRAQ